MLFVEVAELAAEDRVAEDGAEDPADADDVGGTEHVAAAITAEALFTSSGPPESAWAWVRDLLTAHAAFVAESRPTGFDDPGLIGV